jgi:hypothetical protein
MEDITEKKIARKIRKIKQLSENIHLQWDGYPCFFDFLYIYLSNKYKSKCMILFKDQFKFDFRFNEEQNQEYIDNYVDQYGNNMVNECISDKPQVYTFGLKSDHGGHQNLLIFRYKENTIFVEHFEPHGSMYLAEIDEYHKIKSFLELFISKLQPLTSIPIELITSDKVCPYEEGFQGLENLYHLDDPRGGTGFCALWVIFFMEFVLKFPNKTSTQIVRTILGPIQTELATKKGQKKWSDHFLDIIIGYLQLASIKMKKYGNNDIMEITKMLKKNNYEEIDRFDDTTREHIYENGVTPPSSLSTITPSSPSPINIKRKRGSTPNPPIKKTKRSPEQTQIRYQTRSYTKLQTKTRTTKKTKTTKKR